ncbi:MAG: class I SAM-dependent rRNA methyltransferase [Lachnospiraceae bacterium]|nr:class I SAM-dependent rRNA methyltransferase [Lachnospiraceae bacterium]
MAHKRNYPVAVITAKAEKSLRSGHPWVYFDEILSIDDSYENGDIVDVFSTKNRYLGSGFINDNSKIRIRIISRNANDRFDDAFFERRLRYAVDYRLSVMGDDFSSCRLIFGEADMLPGITVDKFENVLVTQSLCLGTDKIKDMLFSKLVIILREKGFETDAIYERNDVAIRKLEGLEEYKGFFKGDGLRDDLDGNVIITENGIKYNVDYMNGQKTGFFLDQKYNRKAVSKIAKGKRVLDCFTHTGSFGLNAAMGGAEYVCSVDISADAIEMASKNAAMNGLDNIVEYKCANVFDMLTEMAEKGKSDFDFIILDPPAFTKSRATVKNAIRGYKEINLKAMKLLPRGGYLATCSCSHFMKDELFRQMLDSAAADAGVSLRQIEARQQGCDHPVLWNVPETDYLKFYIFQVV